jgi:hypothetical protein
MYRNWTFFRPSSETGLNPFKGLGNNGMLWRKKIVLGYDPYRTRILKFLTSQGGSGSKQLCGKSKVGSKSKTNTGSSRIYSTTHCRHVFSISASRMIGVDCTQLGRENSGCRGGEVKSWGSGSTPRNHPWPYSSGWIVLVALLPLLLHTGCCGQLLLWPMAGCFSAAAPHAAAS